ncbi:copper transporter [Proteiniborus sp. MB09-C3]|uniref:copper transporter n=1 Tax=Proteiniborus sp. MB09-C3 TaxID=3050072 RepID=UPI0025571E98|nr:copper transporter [Proteiniborus sp. MB09-C3]WIV10983.1 copper transporter [Proteiniborus sp. MB09-C3]
MTNIKYYVLTVVSIFLALAIGIYIGFMFDAQDILMSQKEDIVTQLEERFDYLEEENKTVRDEIAKVTQENEQIKEFNRAIYGDVIKDKLNGVKIAIIETSEDYIYKGIGQILESAGAEVTSITTIKNNFDSNLELLKDAYEKVAGTENLDNNNIAKLAVDIVAQEIINGEDSRAIEAFKLEGLIDATGKYLIAVDYIVIAGGRKEKDDTRFDVIDKRIIDACKKSNIPIVGVEKENVQFSYIDKYKDNRISSVDNVDTIMGRVALVLAIDGRPGNYGVKPSAESLVPNLGTIIIE